MKPQHNKRPRKKRPTGLVYTRCAICGQIRSHTIAISPNGPMLRCQACGSLRNVAQTRFPFGADQGRKRSR